MSYGADFATADPANAPLDAPLFVGADPFVWGAVLLALIVAGMIGWLMGTGSRSKRGDAVPAIWDAVDDAAKDAMKADTDSLPARASELHRVLKARLGRTLAFGGDLNKCVKALDAALKGEVEDRGHGHHAPHVPSDGHDHKNGGDGDGHAPAAASVTIVSVHASPAAPADPHPRPEPKPHKRPMTTKERNDALRLAVADFNDYWRHRSAREGDMRAVIAELSDPGPRRPHLSHGGGRH